MKTLNGALAAAVVAGSAMLGTAAFALPGFDRGPRLDAPAIEKARIICEPFGRCFRIDAYGRRIFVPRPFGYGRPGFEGPGVGGPAFGRPGFGRPGFGEDDRARQGDQGQRRRPQPDQNDARPNPGNPGAGQMQPHPGNQSGQGAGQAPAHPGNGQQGGDPGAGQQQQRPPNGQNGTPQRRQRPQQQQDNGQQ